MRRALTAGLVAAVVLPTAVLAAMGAPRPSVLPTPLVTPARLAYADAEQRVAQLAVWGDPFGGGDVELAAGPGGGGAADGLAAGPVLPALGELTSYWYPVEQGHRYDAEASTQKFGSGPIPLDIPVSSVFVSARHDPAGDVYLRFEPFGSVPPSVVRLTCDGAVESHPVLSHDGLRVAWATQRDGTWSVAVADLPVDDLGEGGLVVQDPPADLDWCDEVGAASTLLTDDAADETWPAWTPDDERLVFSGTADDPLGDLWSVPSTGDGDLVQVTSGPDADTQPAVADVADGTRTIVAFTTTRFRGDGSVAFVDLSDDGEASTDVQDPYVGEVGSVQGSEPAWGESFDDAWVAFTSRDQDPAGDVWLAHVDTSDGLMEVDFQEPVAAVLGRSESHPSWRSPFEPDALDRPTAWLTITDGPSMIDIHDVRADGSGDERVLANRVEAPPGGGTGTPGPEPLHELSPAYHPAGDRLAYASEHAELADFTWDLSQVVRSTPADQNAGEVLANDDGTPYDHGPFDAEPAWSPDGTRVAFARSPDPQGNAPTRLWVADLVAGTVTQVTTEGEEMLSEDHDPVWTPDGSRLLFSRWFLDDRGLTGGERYAVDSTEIWWVDVVGGTATELRQQYDCGETCDNTVLGRSPALSSDGTQLAVVDLTNVADATDDGVVDEPVTAYGGIGVLTVDTTTTPPTVTRARTLTGLRGDLTATPARATVDGTDHPAWSPDGTEVAFSAHRTGQPQQRGIWAVSAADGEGLRVVTDTPGQQDEPAFRPWTDLVVTLAATPSADGTSTLTVTVTNQGPALVAQGQVDVELPPGLTATAVPGCVPSAASQLTCTLPTPLRGGAPPVVFAIPLQGVTGTSGPVTAVVTSTSPEQDVTDNTATLVPTLVASLRGISVTVDVTPGLVWVGGLPAVATFTIRNLDPQPATDVTLTTAYPAGVVPAGTEPGTEPCLQAAGTCALGTLGADATRVLTAPLGVAPFTGPPQTGLVTGTVTRTTPDPTPADDTASAPLEVRQPTIVVSPVVVRPGGVAFVTGQWFPPGEPVLVSWTPGIMGAPGPYPVADDGTFQASLPVVADTQLGPRRLAVTGTTPGPLFGEVGADLLVTPNSVAAPSFLFRD